MYQKLLSREGRAHMWNKWFKGIAPLLMLPLVLTGCLFGPEKESAPIDPPPKEMEKSEKDSGISEEKPTTRKQDELELYS